MTNPPDDSDLGSSKAKPESPPAHAIRCEVCGDSRKCLTCAGSGVWYAGTLDEDECSSCGGTGHCPDCP
jgi:hypothetical protein